MQRRQSTEEKVLETVNSVPKMRLFYFLRDNDGWFNTSEIANQVDIHRSNLSGNSGQTYLTDMEDDGIVRKRKEGPAVHWDLSEDLHKYTEDPTVHIVPDVDADEDIRAEYEKRNGNIVLTAESTREDDSPPTIEEALLDKFEIAGGLVGLLTLGLLMTLTGVVEALPEIVPQLGPVLFGGALIGLGTVLVIAYQESEEDSE